MKEAKKRLPLLKQDRNKCGIIIIVHNFIDSHYYNYAHYDCCIMIIVYYAYYEFYIADAYNNREFVML